MSYITVEVDTEHGRIVPREPAKLPERATGLLTMLPAAKGHPALTGSPSERVQLPLVRGDGKRIINPSPEQLDVSAWGK